MSSELIINASLPETRIALMEDGEIQELLIERASGKGIVGNIYKGRVTRVLPGMQAAFVDIGLEKAAFLYVDDVYVHSEIWEEEEGSGKTNPLNEIAEVASEAATNGPLDPAVKSEVKADLNLEENSLKNAVPIAETPAGETLLKPVKGKVKIIPRGSQKKQSTKNPELAAARAAAQKASLDISLEFKNRAAENLTDQAPTDPASPPDSGATPNLTAIEASDNPGDSHGAETQTNEPSVVSPPVKVQSPRVTKAQAAKASALKAQEDKNDFKAEQDAWANEGSLDDDDDDHGHHSDDEDDEDEDGDEDSGNPVKMGPDDSDDSSSENQHPHGTIAPEGSHSKGSSENREMNESSDSEGDANDSDESGSSAQGGPEGEGDSDPNNPNRRRHRRGRRGGRFRRRGPNAEGQVGAPAQNNAVQGQDSYPENYHEQVADVGSNDSDRSSMREEGVAVSEASESNAPEGGRPEIETNEANSERRPATASADRADSKAEFRAHRSRDRRIRAKTTSRPVRAQVNIQDLLKEGQEVLVQVAKDPIATKGARLTCHISLPGRHLVCMPTIDHVGVSRRIEREDERRRLREYVEKNRPRNLGFIVRTASGKQQSEKRIKQDIEYLTRLWNEIREKAGTVTAPALVYEDLNAVLRAVRDWVTEEIDKVIVDSRYHFNEILRFVSHFMPPLKQKVELYHGDIPIFDAYGISTELSRALERKVWLKSGGYIVVDQAEALVAIDVNTGRYVGKKNLEDTILKTNLEAVQEIAYQLRLRNCGGIIILDLIDMEKEENKQRVYRALEDALSRDRARPTILKISELGLVEMTRKRTRDTIVRTLCESCTYCEGKGFIKGKQTVAYEVLREIEREGIERDVGKVLVQAHPDVIDILAIDERDTLDQLERRYRKMIYLQAVNDFHPEQFEVTADKRERTDRNKEGHSNEPRSGGDHSERNHDRNRNRHRHDAPHPVIVPVSASGKEPVITPVSASAKADRSDESRAHRGEVSENGDREGIVQVGSGHSGNDFSEDSVGNYSPGNGPIRANGGNPSVQGPSQIVPNLGSNHTNHSSNPSATGEDGFYDEEDRLAFLRAQAAQDAALARLGSGGQPATSSRTPSDPNNNNRGGMGGGRRNTRGRRGGKFRGRNDRNPPRTRGPSKPFGFSQNQKWNNESPKETAANTGDSGDTSSDTPSGGGSGGGSDHSQPPV